MNVYLAEGQELTLIDVGPNTERALAALERALARLGYALEDVRRVIITHAHVDHCGLAATVIARSGARLYTHPYNRPWLEDYEAERERRYRFYADVFRQAGVPPQVSEAVLEANRGLKRYSQAVAVDGFLEDGDVVALDGMEWHVLHTPGHTGGLICLYQAEQRVLLSSDHLLRDVTSNPVIEPPPPGKTQRRRSLVEYLESLRRVGALDVERALPGHGPPIADHRALIAERLAFHQERLAEIEGVLADGERTVYEIACALFPELSPLDTFLAISEIIGHLDVLATEGSPEAGGRREVAGKARVVVREGVGYWRETQCFCE